MNDSYRELLLKVYHNTKEETIVDKSAENGK